MEIEKQVKFQKFTGMVKMISVKTGYNKDFVSRVLNGKVNTDTKGGRKIKALAMQITQNLEQISLDDDQSTQNTGFDKLSQPTPNTKHQTN